jgi:hypothetical protein
MTPDDFKEKRQDASEEEIHKALMEWAGYKEAEMPALKMLHHVPNGGKMPPGSAGKLKGMGMRRGVPDLVLPVPRDPHHGLYLELKSPSGRVRPTQRWWLQALAEEGYAVEVAYRLDDAIEAVEEYLAGEHERRADLSGKTERP